VSELTAAEVIDVMCARFTSGNSVPVERAHIKREDWQALMQLIAEHYKPDDDGRLPPNDPRFNMGLVSDVCLVLQRHGYKPAPQSATYADVIVDLMRMARHFEGLTGLE
jgi:hypothetical protein